MLTTLLNYIKNLNDYITTLVGKQMKISYVRNNVNNTRVTYIVLRTGVYVIDFVVTKRGRRSAPGTQTFPLNVIILKIL